jgi:predicted DCC family thiol-disulfide oxidoreductase YuxK
MGRLLERGASLAKIGARESHTQRQRASFPARSARARLGFVAKRRTEVLYNGVCPVCRAGACDLERRAIAAQAGVIFTDVAAHPEALARAGVSLDDVRLKLHAITPDGHVLRGMPAVSQAWAATPPFRTLGRLTRIAPFSWLAAALYHATAHALWWWNRASGRW